MNETTQLYRHWDADGNLLYVGITAAADQRLKEHVSGSSRSHWSFEIATVTVETFHSRREALEAERRAIFSEAPKYNIGAAGSPAKLVKKPKLKAPQTAIEDGRVFLWQPTYNVSEVAKLFDVTPGRVKSFMDDGLLGYVAIPSGRYPKRLVTFDQIEDFLAQRVVQPTYKNRK